MPSLRCTRKLLKAIGRTPLPAREEATPTLLGDWYANLLRIRRGQALLFTNEATRYSFAVLGVRKAMLTDIAQVFRAQLTLNLVHEDVPPYVMERLDAESRQMGVAATASRSVLGSMNDLAYVLERYVCDAGGAAACDVRVLNAQLNRTPQKPLGWKFAIEALQERLLGVFAVPGPQPHRVFLN